MLAATPIVVVCGPPASGKSTLARTIAEEFRLPLLAKDAIKEVLFDSLGAHDRAWSRRLGAAMTPLLLHLLEEELRAGRPVVVESNFTPASADAAFRKLGARAAYRALQFYCTGDPEVLTARFRARAPGRHPGHVELHDETLADVVAALTDGRHGPLDLGGELVIVDTTSLDALDVDALLAAVAGHLG
jgi:predicted kinase